MTNKLDDDVAAHIQDFTSWATSKGYHVIGALIANKQPDKPMVQVFSSGPDASVEKQKKHMEQLVDILHYTIHKGTGRLTGNFPLGKM